jgi:hypothetical protein
LRGRVDLGGRRIIKKLASPKIFELKPYRRDGTFAAMGATLLIVYLKN